MSLVMFLNGEIDIVRELATFTNFYEALRLPLHPDTKATVDSFFGRGGAFVLLCDKMFGKFVDVYYDDQPEMCWMDLANISPHSSLASALFRCIAPGTPFVNFLEATSMPSPTFAPKLRSGWKGAQASPTSSTKTAAAGASPGYVFDFPLSSFLQNYFRLLTESNDADLYAFTRNKIPGAMLVPFWEPPLMTRKEDSTHQILTSLPCSPLSYFILRLLVYTNRRSEKDGATVISRRPYRGLRSCIRYCEDTVAWVFNLLPPTDFPFSSGIVTAYVQMYVTRSLTQNLSSKISIEDVQWTTIDVAATLLITSSFLLSHRHAPQPVLENNRAAICEPSQLAPILVVTPFLTEMHIALHRGADSAITREALSASVPQNFSDDSVFKAGDDIICIAQTLYRNSIITLREAILSIDRYPHCRFMHFNSILELWLALMNPQWRGDDTRVGFNYISRHYEAYSFATVGVLKLAVKSTMVDTLNRTGVELFLRCLQQLEKPVFCGIADAVHNASVSRDDTLVLAAVKRNFVLNWADDAVSLSLMDIRNDEVCERAAQLFVILEQKCAADDLAELNDLFRSCMPALLRAFPGADQFLTKWRKGGNTSTASGNADDSTQSRRSSVDASSIGNAGRLTEEQKKDFFDGTRRRIARTCADARFPTLNGRGYHLTLQTCLYPEFPILVPPTRVLDAVIERVMEFYYTTWILKCDRGHSMDLLSTDRVACSNHPGGVAIWQCAICETTYGSCCRILPVLSDGTQLGMTKCPGGGALCWRCGESFAEGSVCFAPARSTHRVLCAGCASRPFKPFSTRFLASYQTWAAIFAIFITYYYLSKLLFGDAEA